MTYLFSLLSATSLAIALVAPSIVHAEFYKYKDSSGALVITNKLEDVPKKYRKRVKVVWDDELTAKDPYARRVATAEARREQQEREQKVKQNEPRKLQSSDGKMLVIKIDEETGQVIRTME